MGLHPVNTSSLVQNRYSNTAYCLDLSLITEFSQIRNNLYSLRYLLTAGQNITNSLYSFLRGDRFESPSGHRIFLTEFLRGFSQTLQTNSGIISEFGHHPYVPNPFQFFIHLSPYHHIIRCYICQLLKMSLSNQQRNISRNTAKFIRVR